MRFLIFFCCLLAGSAAVAGEYRIGTVDMQVLLKQYPGTAPAQERFNALAAKKKRALGDEEKILADLQDELRSSAGVMSEEERNEKQEEYRTEARSYEDKKAQMQKELDDRNQEVAQALADQIKAIVAKIAKNRGFNLVLDLTAAVNVSGGEDLTQAVLESFSKLNPKDFQFDSNP